MSLNPVPVLRSECTNTLDFGHTENGFNCLYVCPEGHSLVLPENQGFTKKVNLLERREIDCLVCGRGAKVNQWLWRGICKVEFEFERHGSSSSGGGIGGGSGGGSSGGSSGGGIGGGSGGGSSGVSESQNCFFEGFDGKIRDCPDDGILYYVIYVRGMEELKRLKMSVSPWSKKRCGKEDRKKKEGHRKLEETKGEYGRERAPLVESRREVGRELRRVKRENRERGRRKKEIDRKVVKNYKEIEGTREILKDVCEKIRDGDVFERQNSKKKLNDQIIEKNLNIKTADSILSEINNLLDVLVNESEFDVEHQEGEIKKEREKQEFHRDKFTPAFNSIASFFKNVVIRLEGNAMHLLSLLSKSTTPPEIELLLQEIEDDLKEIETMEKDIDYLKTSIQKDIVSLQKSRHNVQRQKETAEKLVKKIELLKKALEEEERKGEREDFFAVNRAKIEQKLNVSSPFK